MFPQTYRLYKARPNIPRRLSRRVTKIYPSCHPQHLDTMPAIPERPTGAASHLRNKFGQMRVDQLRELPCCNSTLPRLALWPYIWTPGYWAYGDAAKANGASRLVSTRILPLLS